MEKKRFHSADINPSAVELPHERPWAHRNISMKTGRYFVLAIAVASSLLAALLAKQLLSYSSSTKTVVKVESPVKLGKVVVAKQALRYGEPLTKAQLTLVEWPTKAIPAGTFHSLSEVLPGDKKRVVLSSIEANEPLLAWKLTGPGQRASLSAMLKPDTKAVTIKVNDVRGVGGFVLPGDRVDVLLTRLGDKNDPGGKYINNLLLQDVHVLAIDQQADDRHDRPIVAKTATLEVDTISAQKLTLAATAGTLSLALRQPGSDHILPPRQMALSDLFVKNVAKRESNRNHVEVKETLSSANLSSKVRVVRALKETEYSVTSEESSAGF